MKDFIKNNSKIINSLVISLLFIIGINYMIMDSFISIIYIILFLLISYLFFNNIYGQKNKLIKVYSIISSFIYLIGQEIYFNHSFDCIIENPIKYLFLLLGVYSVFLIIFSIIFILYDKYLKNIKTKKVLFSKNTIVISIMVMVLVYLYCYFCYFPGIASYDYPTQMDMIYGKVAVSNFHPIIHTAIISTCTFFEYLTNINNLGIVLYSLIQITLVIFTYLYFISWIKKNNWSKGYIVFVYLYFLLNPIFSLFSIIVTKDVYFSCFLLLFSISFIDYFKEKNWSNYFSLSISGILICLFRNNMIYPMLIFLIIMLFLYRKKEFITCLLSIVIVYLIIVKGLYSFLGFRSISTQEMLSVPLLQMSDVYVNTNTYSDTDKEDLRKFAINIGNYNPRFADGVKYDFNGTALKNDPKLFLSLYFKGLTNHPLRYVSTFLDLNIPYWYPNSDSVDKYSKRVYIEDDLYNKNSKRPLENSYNFYHSFAQNDSFLQKIPILSNYYSLYFTFWFFLITSFIYFISKKRKYIIYLMLLLFMYFCTYLLGPVSNFRYVYPFYILMPLLFGLIIFDKESNSKKN